MVAHLGNLYGDNGLYYGREWEFDAIDLYCFGKLSETADQRRQNVPNLPHVALDIGCGTGKKVTGLARLGIFDRIIGCDIGNRFYDFQAHQQWLAPALKETAKPPCPIEFRFKNISELEPSQFEDLSVQHVNCRRMLQFLSPPDLRKALKTIHDIAAPEALVTISFDGTDKNEWGWPR